MVPWATVHVRWLLLPVVVQVSLWQLVIAGHTLHLLWVHVLELLLHAILVEVGQLVLPEIAHQSLVHVVRFLLMVELTVQVLVHHHGLSVGGERHSMVHTWVPH